MSFSIFCTGSSGLVASDFKRLVISQHIPFYGLDLHGENEVVDISDKNSVFNFLKTKSTQLPTEQKPILFHFAAITVTGNNLTDEQISLTKKVNVDSTRVLLEICRKLEIPLVHISTDFVFSGGKKTDPYLPEDELCPDDALYSQTKAEAERIVKEASKKQYIAIIRLAFPYGNFSHPKPCLVRKMLTWMESKPEVSLYSDQKICPTPIEYFSLSCLKTAKVISGQKLESGQILHCVGKQTTPYEFGSMVKKIFNKPANVNPSQIQEGARNLVLDTQKTQEILNINIPLHEESLKRLR